MGSLGMFLQNFRLRMKLDRVRQLGRQYPVFCFLLLVLLLSTVLLNRYLHIIMVFWSFLAGVVTFYCSLGPESLLPNMLVSIRPKSKQELFPLGHSCAVCGKTKCKRHRPTLLLENYQPWLDLRIPSKVDASLSEILELVLENFVYPWYREITDDEAFVDELRVTLRFFSAVLIRRIQKVDVASLITQKLLKVSMKHIEIISKARLKVKSTEHLQQAALEEYGPDLHVALRSRRDELLYLRKLTEVLFPHILPPKSTDCRSLTLLIREVLAGSVFLPSMDYLADPDTVNHLILLFIDNSPPEEATEPSSTLVPFLQKYSDVRNKKPSVLKLELKEIREQQDLLFRFMNFLKQEGAVHVLQFCLTVEEFNDKILCPELSDTEKMMLHEEVKKIYETYCLEESIDKIRFDPFIVEEIRNGKIIKAVPSKLIKEKGQHLEPFIQSYFNSCESPKPKPSRPELTILSPTSENDKKLFNDVFKNNANRSETTDKRHNQNYFMEMITVEGVYDYLMYVGESPPSVEATPLHHFGKMRKSTFFLLLIPFLCDWNGEKKGKRKRCACRSEELGAKAAIVFRFSAGLTSFFQLYAQNTRLLNTH
uniref:Sorting nexin 14 n=1 Tax=Oryzias sinensis TaxID=183150 RepID=A0A8C7ZBC8_9TELE